MSYKQKLAFVAVVASLMATGLAGWKWNGGGNSGGMSPAPAKADFSTNGWSWGGDGSE